MRAKITITWTRAVIGIVALFTLGVGGALLVAWSGIYSVAASRGHPAWLNAFLELGMRRSVEANAKDIAIPELTDPGLIRLGAAHFHDGCAPCHGAPGKPVNPIYQGMLPVPPSLQEHADEWTATELHWIIKHGLQYAGMPGWAATMRDDEVWAMVAFLQAMSEMDEADYITLAAGNARPKTPSVTQLVHAGGTGISLATCSKCHDTAEAPPTSAHVPRLGGQPEAYLVRALSEYRGNLRQSGFMEPVAAEIPEEDITAIAAYFSRLDSPRHEAGEPADADLDAGMEIALNGDPGRRVAACHACHDAAARPAYPRLAGQSEVWLETQIRLWRDAPPASSPYADLMAGAMGRMSDAQIRNVAAWYARQTPAAGPMSEPPG